MNYKKAIALVTAASLLAGCGGSNGSNGGKELKEGDTVKIGFIGPLTGPTSSYGIPVKNSIELAIEDYNNSADAKYKIELLAEDTQGKGKELIQLITNLLVKGL